MKFTQSWLTRHSKIKLPTEKISEALTNIGLEVESIIKPNKNLKYFKIAKILNVSKHPNADKLKVCDVDIGKNKVKVVCVQIMLERPYYCVYLQARLYPKII